MPQTIIISLMLFLTGLSWDVAAVVKIVKIKDFAFSPQIITIDIGDEIEWVNQDGTTHTTTSEASSEIWDATLSTGKKFRRKFLKNGEFGYVCDIHPEMTGTVKVRTTEQTRIQVGKDILAKGVLPIKLNLVGKKPDLVYTGSYIVNAQGGCADCHSCPTYSAKHNPFVGQPKQFKAASYLAGGVSFGPLKSPNLTPDVTGKPAGITLAQFKNAFRTGKDPHVPSSILQIMPWPVYGSMSDYDLNAVYEYLRAIPRRATPPATACTGTSDSD